MEPLCREIFFFYVETSFFLLCFLRFVHKFGNYGGVLFFSGIYKVGFWCGDFGVFGWFFRIERSGWFCEVKS